jgi:hypothetical protein
MTAPKTKHAKSVFKNRALKITTALLQRELGDLRWKFYQKATSSAAKFCQADFVWGGVGTGWGIGFSSGKSKLGVIILSSDLLTGIASVGKTIEAVVLSDSNLHDLARKSLIISGENKFGKLVEMQLRTSDEVAAFMSLLRAKALATDEMLKEVKREQEFAFARRVVPRHRPHAHRPV